MKNTKAWLFCGMIAVAGIVLAAACVGIPYKKVPASRLKRLPAGAIALDYHDGHIYLNAQIFDSLPAHLVFDTGASGLYLDSLWLLKSGFAPQRNVKGRIIGAGTDTQFVRVILDSIPFAVDTLCYQSTLTPILALKEILGLRVDGIFGQRYLADACVEINLKQGYMRAVRLQTLAAAGFVRMPVVKRDYRIYVPMRVQFDSERFVDGEFMLDMGSGGILDIASPAARRAEFEEVKNKKILYNTISGGVGGESSYIRSRARWVSFGRYKFTGVLVDVSMNESGVLAGDDMAGLIGNRFMERFDFAIDFGEPALWLRPMPDINAPFRYLSPGFTMLDRTDIGSGWIVTGIFDAHAPEGLQAGDTIVTWDRTPVDRLDINRAQETAGRHRIGVMRDGVETEYICLTKELL